MSRDRNRLVRPFDYGLEWCGAPDLKAFVNQSLADSNLFFSYKKPARFSIKKSHLSFVSPLVSPFTENNTVHAAYFPAPENKNRKKRAVLVLPQWNAGADGHVSLCKLLNRFGISALRLTLAYHDRRRPAGLERAEYHLSSNIGRTIHAARQSVIDARASLDWLETQGYQRLGILGTSLGSCIASIATAHDSRVKAAVFNHVAMYFADVVWTGLSTQHVRQGFDGQVTHADLRHYWSVISPGSYLHRFQNRDLRILLIWARHDSSFLPVYSQQVLESFRQLNLPHEVFCLPCGHYTTGRFPFNLMDGLAMCRFLARSL